MLNQTKIVVLSKKKLILSLILIMSIILVFIVIYLSHSLDNDHKTHKNNNTESPIGLDTYKATYSPGVYSSALCLDGNYCDVLVTVDSDNIKDIKIMHQNEAVQTSYPGISVTFDEIASKVKANGSTNIDYDSTNRYTYSLFIDVIDTALQKSLLKH